MITALQAAAQQGDLQQGNNVKIGFIDMREIIFTSDVGKQAAMNLKEIVEKKKASIQQAEAELRKMKENLEKQRSVLKEDTMREKEADYQRQYRDYQRLVQDANEDLAARDQQLTQRLVPEIMKIVNSYGEKEGFTLIIDINNPVIVFHSKSKNLTKIIIAEMNKGTKGKK
jgi:outer membrane protein